MSSSVSPHVHIFKCLASQLATPSDSFSPCPSVPGSLRESRYCVRHVVCRAQEHGYCEGGQHLRPTRYKTSRFDTSVFFLQNKAAQRKWPVTDEVG